MFIWTLENGGFTWHMRGTTWTSDRDRATTYRTTDEALEAKNKASKFMKARDAKRMKMVFA